MAERIYTGLVQKQLRGNRDDARTLEREARIKVGYLFDAMRPGETFKTGSWSMSDGRRILAFVWNDVLGKRATVRLTGVGGEPVLTQEMEFAIESGWLTYQDDPIIYTFDPLLAWYLAGNGNTTVHVWGLDDVCQLNSAFRFKDIPELGTENEYVSTLAPRKDPDSYSEIKPYYYSGLTRLFMQARRGADRYWSEDFSSYTHFSNSPGSLGCVRSPYGDYWLIHASEDGVWALRLGQDAKCLQEDADSVAGPDIDRAQADAVTMALLDPAGDEVCLLESTNASVINAHYDGLNLLDSIAWGWCWRHQRRGASDEHISGAVRVGYHTNFNYTATEWRIFTKEAQLAITWPERDTPVAAITIANEWLFGPTLAGGRLCTCNSNETLLRFIPPVGYVGLTAAGVALAWYAQNGEIMRVEWEGGDTVTDSGPSVLEWGDIAAAVVGCGSDTVSASDERHAYARASAWSVSDPLVQKRIERTTDVTYSITMSAEMTSHSPFGYAASPSTFTGCDGVERNGYFWDPAIYGYENTNLGWIESGVLNLDHKINTVVFDGGAQNVLIGECPGVAWVVTSGITTTTTNVWQHGYRPNLPYAYGGLCSSATGDGPEVAPGVNSWRLADAVSSFIVTDTTTTTEGPTVTAGIVTIGQAITAIDSVGAAQVGECCSSPTRLIPVYGEGANSFQTYLLDGFIEGLPIPNGASLTGIANPGLFIGGI